MIRAYSSPASSICAWSTTSLTAPQASACSAEYSRARKKISRARFCPTCRASSAEPYPPSNEPTLASVCMKRACSRLAMLRSATTCSECPPPAAQPFTSATTTFGMVRISRCTSRMCRRPARAGSTSSAVSPDAYW